MVCVVLAAGCGGEEQSRPPSCPARSATCRATRSPSRSCRPTSRASSCGASSAWSSPPCATAAAACATCASLLDGEERLDFDRDIEPLLGGTLVVAAWGDARRPEASLAALETPDADEAAKALLREARSSAPTTPASTATRCCVVARRRRRATLDAADRAPQGRATGWTPRRSSARSATAPSDDALVRVLGDPRVLARRARRGRRRAVDPGARVGRALDPPRRATRSPAACALATASGRPRARRTSRSRPATTRRRPATSTARSPPPTATRAAPPSSSPSSPARPIPTRTFVREVEALEADLGISFEDEVLEAVQRAEREHRARPTARSRRSATIADPERMRALLPSLAPRLPAILRGLQGLGNTRPGGAAAVRPRRAAGAGRAAGAARRHRGAAAGRLPGTRSCTRSPACDDESDESPSSPCPSVVFGMIGDRFVVGTDASHARTAAKMEVSEVDDAHGAAVARADLGTVVAARRSHEIGIETLPLGRRPASSRRRSRASRAGCAIDGPGRAGLDALSAAVTVRWRRPRTRRRPRRGRTGRPPRAGARRAPPRPCAAAGTGGPAVIAANASATATMRAPSGIASPGRPSG